MSLFSFRSFLLLLQIHCAVALAFGQVPRSYAQEQTVNSALVIRSFPGYLETIASKDPIEASIVFGTWTPPKVGDLVEYNDTLKVRWEQMKVDSTGWFRHPLLDGAYVYVPLSADREEIVLLEGMGHSMVYVNGSPRAGSGVASVGAVSGTGIVGMRHTNKASYLMPGIGFPDCLVESAEVRLRGEEGVRAAGFFGLDWGVETGEFAWNER